MRGAGAGGALVICRGDCWRVLRAEFVRGSAGLRIGRGRAAEGESGSGTRDAGKRSRCREGKRGRERIGQRGRKKEEAPQRCGALFVVCADCTKS